MLPRPPLPPGPFLVVGLARSGVAVARALRQEGQEVVGCDAGPVPESRRAEVEAAGIPVHAETEGIELLAQAKSVVKSPGVPQEAALVRAARLRGVPVVGELEIGWRLVPNEFIVVTGSNGKTTTVELIGHVHRAAGVASVVVGNVGTPLSSLAGAGLPEGAVVVCEASSFQLEDTEHFAPDAAVLLNLAEDHLDRHGSLAAYRAAKLQAFARQPAGTVAVVPDELAGDLPGDAERVTFGPGGGPGLSDPGGHTLPDRGGGARLSDRDGALWWDGERLMGVEEIRMRGAHNRLNAMAAAAVTLARGLDPEAVRAGLASFGGVAHRLEEIATIDGVLYVNDSKATNVASAAVGISSFDGGVHVILGGRGKGGDYRPLAAPVAERARAAYLIGETAAELHAALEPSGVPLHSCGDLEHALAAARAAARAGDVVLLSPACASYDQYPDYEARGAHFRALVEGDRGGRRTQA